MVFFRRKQTFGKYIQNPSIFKKKTPTKNMIDKSCYWYNLECKYMWYMNLIFQLILQFLLHVLYDTWPAGLSYINNSSISYMSLYMIFDKMAVVKVFIWIDDLIVTDLVLWQIYMVKYIHVHQNVLL